MDSEDENGQLAFTFSDTKVNDIIQDLDGRLHGMRNCYKLIRRHGDDLQRALIEFQSTMENNSDAPIMKTAKLISEKSALVGIAVRAMLSCCESYINSAESDTKKLIKSFESEKARTRELETMVHDVALEHSYLERRTARFSQFVTFPTDDEDIDERDSSLRDKQEPKVNKRSPTTSKPSLHWPNFKIQKKVKKFKSKLKKEKEGTKDTDKGTETEDDEDKTKERDSDESRVQCPTGSGTCAPADTSKGRRVVVPHRPSMAFSAWSVLKHNIGKDLTKISMPINLNEPITTLQRITEELEYAALLDAAASIDDKYEQLAYLAAFSISIYSPTATRTLKPFNPLLGETYEYDRSQDLGWRSIAEQVSHHPPMSAMHCEGRGWTLWQCFGMTTKFRGKSIQVRHNGSCNCRFHKSGAAYTFNKATTVVNNIIVGKMWMDQHGQVDIVGYEAAAGIKCELNYIPYTMFSSSAQRRVHGVITDENDKPRWLIKGHWDHKVEIASISAAVQNKNDLQYETEEYRVIWERSPIVPDSVFYHNFSEFTCGLNEFDPSVSPTDSRRRPDVRLMEEGLWDECNTEKTRLEKRQRDRRSLFQETRSSSRESGLVASIQDVEVHEPVWFKREVKNGEVFYKYDGTYWDAKKYSDWSRCPDLFS